MDDEELRLAYRLAPTSYNTPPQLKNQRVLKLDLQVAEEVKNFVEIADIIIIDALKIQIAKAQSTHRGKQKARIGDTR